MVATSFPYLRVSREYGIRYELVLMAVEMLESGSPVRSLTAGPNPPMWMVATAAAWLRERWRRILDEEGRWPSNDVDISGVRAAWRIPASS